MHPPEVRVRHIDEKTLSLPRLIVWLIVCFRREGDDAQQPSDRIRFIPFTLLTQKSFLLLKHQLV